MSSAPKPGKISLGSEFGNRVTRLSEFLRGEKIMPLHYNGQKSPITDEIARSIVEA